MTITSPSTTLPGRCRLFDERLGNLLSSFQPHTSSSVHLRTGNAITRNADHAKIRTALSHHHRDPHRTSNYEHHLLAPSSRHGCLCSLQARIARRRSCGCDARCACGCLCRNSTCANNSNCCDDGLAAIRKRTRVHDGTGQGRCWLAA